MAIHVYCVIKDGTIVLLVVVALGIVVEITKLRLMALGSSGDNRKVTII